jgi:chromosomal replication initiator protein
LTVDIQPPDFETRLAILQSKAEQAQASVGPDVLDMMAHEVKQNIRELEGSLNRIIAYARLLRAQITPELAQKALKDVAGMKELPAAPTNLENVISIVARTFALSVDDLLGRKRDKETAQARQVAMYVIRKRGGCSLSDIGAALGGRNPSTVSHACEKVAEDMTNSHILRRRVEDIQKNLSAER